MLPCKPFSFWVEGWPALHGHAGAAHAVQEINQGGNAPIAEVIEACVYTVARGPSNDDPVPAKLLRLRGDVDAGQGILNFGDAAAQSFGDSLLLFHVA